MPDEKNLSDGAAAEGPRPRDLKISLTRDSLEAFLLGETTLGQVLGVDVREAYAIAEMAYTLAQGGDLERAVALAEGLVLLNPRHAYFHGLLASIYIRQERNDDALRHLDQAIELDPADVASRVNRGEILLTRGGFQGALADFSRAIELDPQGKDPMTRRAQVLVALGAEVLRRSLESGGQRAVS